MSELMVQGGCAAGSGPGPVMPSDGLPVSARCGGAPRTRELVADAVGVLGTLLRDERVIHRAVKDCQPRDTWLTQSLLVASGLLGHWPTLQPDDWTNDTVEAGLLSLVLRKPVEAEQMVRMLRTWIPESTRWAARGALIQAECGEWLGLVG